METEPLEWLQHMASELEIGPLEGGSSIAEQYSEFLLRIGEQIEFGSKEQKLLARRIFWAGYLYLLNVENGNNLIRH